MGVGTLSCRGHGPSERGRRGRKRFSSGGVAVWYPLISGSGYPGAGRASASFPGYPTQDTAVSLLHP